MTQGREVAVHQVQFCRGHLRRTRRMRGDMDEIPRALGGPLACCHCVWHHLGRLDLGRVLDSDTIVVLSSKRCTGGSRVVTFVTTQAQPHLSTSAPHARTHHKIPAASAPHHAALIRDKPCPHGP